MNYIEYFNDKEKDCLKNKLREQEADWKAINYLIYLLDNEDKLAEYLGDYKKLYFMIENDEIVSLCTLSDRDCILDDNMYPWIGFVYTYPKYRGKRYSGKLIDYVIEKAKEEGFNKVYVSTGEEGLYERFGFEYLETRIDRWDDEGQILFRRTNNIAVSNFSNEYNVRFMKKEEAPFIFEMTQNNTLYYEYCGREGTIDDITNDFNNVPPGKDISDVYYVGYFNNDELVAVLVLLDRFPNNETMYIGFFMMNVEYQGKGIGTRIIEELTTYIKDKGYKYMELGIDKGNPQSSHFWKKNGFEEIREVEQDGHIVIAARKEL